jgi:hypothetical protein
MKKQAKSGLKLQYKTTQIIVQRRIIIGGSILSIMIAGIIYLNFSNSYKSKANVSEILYEPSLRSIDIEVPKQLIQKNKDLGPKFNRPEEVSKRRFISRSKDYIEIESNLNNNNIQ